MKISIGVETHASLVAGSMSILSGGGTTHEFWNIFVVVGAKSSFMRAKYDYYRCGYLMDSGPRISFRKFLLVTKLEDFGSWE